MNQPRASGIVLHPTSLPAPIDDSGQARDAGSGDFGAAARRFIDWMASAGQSLWQVLPFNPVGPGFSPYTSSSAHAGNPLLVSPDELAAVGLLDGAMLANEYARLQSAPAHIDVDASQRLRMRLLHLAAGAFFSEASRFAALHAEYRDWCAEQQSWLADYSLFMALRGRYGEHCPWPQWPAELAAREGAALRAARASLSAECDFWCFVQWSFARQWQALRAYAAARGLRVVGDLPIYVAFDSVDVWAARDLFDLDAAGQPRVVAGVPPDYFSAEGQLWGNPLYHWPRHAEQGYAWWQARLRSALRHADIVRIDHFRALESYWEVSAAARTAVDGRWQAGPGQAFFTALEQGLATAPGALPLIAEDLGTITPAVHALRRAAGLPGMRVLQFGFAADAHDLNLPHNLPEDCVVYTGTHDNDTSLGWFARASAHERNFVRTYLKSDGHEIGWDLIHAASMSAARYAIYPLQDVLGLGSEARMNTPGLADGQWRWRFQWHQLQDWQARRLRQISAVHGRNGLDVEQALL
ncbi:MAG: 4-alpha-glucanotransferase [Gammaproteobacteria bacterium]|nr:4-alpha-glucanotransferase [Gammaproteobacteria bacterium]